MQAGAAPLAVYLSEGDVGETLRFKLIFGANAVPGNLPSASVSVRGAKPDGTEFDVPATFGYLNDSPMVSVVLTEDMTSAYGRSEAKLIFEHGEDQLGSSTIYFEVEPMPSARSIPSPIIPVLDQVQADWTETDPDSKAYIQHKPYIPPAQVQADWAETNSSAKSYIRNKPSSLTEFQADWRETNPTSLSYIKNKPYIPPGQVQADWAEENEFALSYILNKPDLSELGVQSDWNVTDPNSKAYILHKPDIAAILTAIANLDRRVRVLESYHQDAIIGEIDSEDLFSVTGNGAILDADGYLSLTAGNVTIENDLVSIQNPGSE